jgi:REP element-mobilizing transposase RayT
MARRLRESEPGDTHHIFARGVERSAIFVDGDDYDRATRLLAASVSRFELQCHSWCFMPNHAHLLVTAPNGNLSNAMKWYFGRVAQSFNHRHGRFGHLFQDRFGSRLIQSDRHFLEVARYIPLNPVRARICHLPEEWAWSSYAVTAGLRPPLAFLDTAAIFEQVASPAAFACWVGDGLESTYLDESGAPRRPSLASLLAHRSDAGLLAAHLVHDYTITEIARHLGEDRSRVSRRVKALALDARMGSDPDRARRESAPVRGGCVHDRCQTPFVRVSAPETCVCRE